MYACLYRLRSFIVPAVDSTDELASSSNGVMTCLGSQQPYSTHTHGYSQVVPLGLK
jgi:hypothetical protein